MPNQARDISDMIKNLLQNKPKPGATHTTLFTPLTILTKDTMQPGSCWSLEPKK